MEKILFGWLVLMLAGVAVASTYVIVDHATRCDRFHFSAAAWVDPHAHHNEIAHRLVDCHRLEGQREDELRANLGPPLERYRLRNGHRVWLYDAGISGGSMLPSYETLNVELSDSHVVRRARLDTHTGSD